MIALCVDGLEDWPGATCSGCSAHAPRPPHSQPHRGSWCQTTTQSYKANTSREVKPEQRLQAQQSAAETQKILGPLSDWVKTFQIAIWILSQNGYVSRKKNALVVQLELIIIQVHGNVGSTYSSIGNNNISNIIQVSFNVILCILVQYSDWLVCRHESWQKSVLELFGLNSSGSKAHCDLGGLFGTMTECFSHNCQFHLGQGGHENFTPAPFSLPHSTIKDL